MSTRKLLPVCLSSWTSLDAMGSKGHCIYLPSLDGESSDQCANGSNKLQNGGLYCDSNGQISKPFPDKPYCQSTATNIGAVNNAGGVVSFCQTVLPGNEAMLIPTEVNDYATLVVPGTDYWGESITDVAMFTLKSGIVTCIRSVFIC